MAKKDKFTLTHKDADRHLLYQWSVQDPEQEVEFAVKQYKRRRGRSARVLREDFCGTATVACQWVASHPKRTAMGLDLDQSTLAWAREYNLSRLGKDSGRVDLRNTDVRTVTNPKADVVLAENFSYYLLSEQSALVGYFQTVRQSLKPDGIFILDCYGGWESQQVMKERRTVKCDKGTFGYVWDQADFNPIDNRALCHIHFEFKNGKRLKKAFTYDWRLYTPGEVCDALKMAGFGKCQVYWDVNENKDTSDFRPRKRVPNSAGWIAYVVGENDVASHNGNGKR